MTLLEKAARGDLDARPGVFECKHDAARTVLVWLALSAIVGIILAGIFGICTLAS